MGLAANVEALHGLAELDTDAVVLDALHVCDFLHCHADGDPSEIGRLFRIEPGGIFHCQVV